MNIDTHEITVVLYDDLGPNCDDIRNNLYDLTNFKVGGSHKFKTISTRNITDTIRELCVNNTSSEKWAVIIGIGTFLQGQNVIFDTVKHAKQENAPLACHILDRGGYYHFHQQWFALNLKTYADIGSPSFEESQESIQIHTRETERCPDNAHDDYTPWWVRPKSQNLVTYTSDRGYFGIRVVGELIQAGHDITNIPQVLRKRKDYCYPAHNHDDIVAIIKDPTHQPKDVALQYFNKTMVHLVDNLKKGYYVLNTELISEVSHEHMQFDCFVGVCGGIKPAIISGGPNFSETSEVYLVDISPAAINWQKYLLANWDGNFDNFENVYNTFQEIHKLDNYVPIYTFGQTDKNHVHNVGLALLENFNQILSVAKIDKNEFYDRWNKYRNQTHHFVNIDLNEDGAIDKILDCTKNSKVGAYIWLSNVFEMDYLMFYKTKKCSTNQGEIMKEIILAKATVPTALEIHQDIVFSPNVK